MTITVLVPTIGRMEYLPATKRSLDEQTRRNFRVIVLDNASPPEGREFVRAWEASDPRVTVLRVDERIPMFSNFNRGMRAVQTPLVTFFHDDDIYLPRYLEVLSGILEAHPRAAFAGSNYDHVDGAGRVLERRRWIKRTEPWSGERYITTLVGRGRNLVTMQGLMFRRSAFPTEGFDESLPIHFGDFVLLMRAAEDGGLVVVEETLIQVRRHAAQASVSLGLSKGIAMRTEVLLAYLDELVSRRPELGRRIAQLRRRVMLGHRTGLVWGWVASDDDRERTACLDALGCSVIAGALRWVDAHDARPPGLGRRLGRVARVAADVLRL
jgi:glycosyltransferase involved in cell wall biosynthesis